MLFVMSVYSVVHGILPPSFCKVVFLFVTGELTVHQQTLIKNKDKFNFLYQ